MLCRTAAWSRCHAIELRNHPCAGRRPCERDGVDCPGLDVAAAFFAGAVAVTDLNGDGKAEVTVPYRFSCGGGVDSAQIKIILRDGPVKLSIRGQSRVELPDQAGFGGEHTHDKALLEPANAAFKQHLDAVWRAVSVEKR